MSLSPSNEALLGSLATRAARAPDKEAFAASNRMSVLTALNALAAEGGAPLDEVALALVLGLCEQPGLKGLAETPAVLARLAQTLRCAPGSNAARAMLAAVGAGQGAWDPAARGLLAVAAGRRDIYGYAACLDLALAGLPETAAIATRLLGEGKTEDLPTALRAQRGVLLIGAGPGRDAALQALYRGLGAHLAGALLPALDEVGVARPTLSALVGVALVTAGPLQLALVRLATVRRYPELRALVEWIAADGEDDAQAAAAEALRALSAQVDPGSEPLVASQCRAVEAAVKAAPADPWSPGDRRAALAGPREAVLELVERAAARARLSGSAAARLEAAVVRLGPGLTGERVRRCLVKLATVPAAWTGSGLTGPVGAARLQLLRAIDRGEVRLTPAERAQLAAAAPEAAPMPYSLARLGLPFTLAAWRALRAAMFDQEAVHEWDQKLALALGEDEAGPVLEALYGDATPNQRRALVRAAPIGRTPEHLRSLLEIAHRLDPSMFPALIARIGEERPAGAGGELLRLAESEMPMELRRQAIVGLAGFAGREMLERIGAIEEEALQPEVCTTLAAVRLRLEAGGQQFDEGGVSVAGVDDSGQIDVAGEAGAVGLATDGRPLSLARPEVATASPPQAPTPAVPGTFARLGAPPRRIPAPVLLGLLAFCDHRWGVVLFNLLGVDVQMLLYRPFPRQFLQEYGILAAMLAGFAVMHAWTRGLLRALRGGALTMATVKATLTTGRHPDIKHALRFLGDDGKLHVHVVRRSARVLALQDDRLEPMLVRSGPGGAPIDMVALGELRLVAADTDGTLHLKPLGWLLAFVTLTLQLSVAWELFAPLSWKGR